MLRRGNKSHKVPNVKLRPAAPQRRRSPECLVEETQPLGSDDSPMKDTCPRPFAGMVFCATGNLDKMVLFKKAIELGAKATQAFTERVTHLIASDHGGAKYNCALEHKIPILKPTYITENYEVWLRGDDVDAVESMSDHRHSIFSSVVICVSGIEDIDRRVEINKLVNQNGGSFRKDLQRPVDVTHLLCSGDETTDKMHYAEKFNQRGETDIKLVWEEWFWDCLEFGGRFDEEKYLVKNHPRPERRRPVEAPPQPSIPDTSTDAHQSQPAASRRMSTDRAPQKSQKEDDADLDDEEAGMANTNYTALCIWESLLKVRGYTIDNNRIVHSPSKTSSTQPASGLTVNKRRAIGTGEDSDIDDDNGEVGGSVLSTLRGFRKQNSFVIRKEPARTVSGSLSRRNTPAETRPSTPRPEPVPEQPEASGSRPRNATNFLVGKRFTLIGEADSPSVRNALTGAGGLMCAELDTDADFIIVRLADLGRLSGLSHVRERIRTECWVEKCICEKRICNASEHLSFTPLNAALFPLADTSRIILSFSGLDEAEACWIRRLLKAVGITHAPTFTRRTTHLLCPSRTGKKFEKAPEWGIQVVDMEWLRVIAREGRIPGIASERAPVDGKGKGRMQDITSETANIPTAARAQASSTPLFGKDSFGPPDLLIPTPNDSFGQPSLLIPALDTAAAVPDNGHVSSSATPSPMKVGGSYSLGQIQSPSRSASPEKPPDTSPAKIASPSVSPSKGPSPMRRKRSSNSLSPTKVPPEASRALQASIASLLGGNGKRAADAEAGPRKRPKPDFRIKATVRTPSPPHEESYAPLQLGEVEESVRVVYAADAVGGGATEEILSSGAGSVKAGAGAGAKGARSKVGARRSVRATGR